MNLAAARAAIAAIAKFCPHDEWRLQAIEALEYLDDDGPTEEVLSRPRPLTNAEKCARRRLRAKGVEPPARHRPSVSRDTAATPSDIADGVAAVSHGVAVASRDLDLDLHLSKEIQDLRGSLDQETRESATLPATPSDTADGVAAVSHGVAEERAPGPARRPATNATDDGCAGFAISAWREGVREAIGRPITLSLGVVRHLVDVLIDHCPDSAKRELFAHQKAAAWARARQAAGLSINPHNFADWLTSGERLSSPRMMQTSAEESPEARSARQRAIEKSQRARDEEWKRLEQQVTPMPAELLEVVGAGRPGIRRAGS